MRDVLAPAIDLAERGFPVAPITAYFWQRGAQATTGQLAGRARVDDRWARRRARARCSAIPTLARTLRAVAEGGKEAFYRGEIARKIAETVQAHGGVMTVEDLAAHESTWDDARSARPIAACACGNVRRTGRAWRR